MQAHEDSEVDQQTAAGEPKACCICGLDVTSRKRQRDPEGRYWCASCAETDSRQKRSGKGEICSDCGCSTPSKELLTLETEKICQKCQAIRTAEKEQFDRHRDAVASDPEHLIRRRFDHLLVAGFGVLVFGAWTFGWLPSWAKRPPAGWNGFFAFLFWASVVAWVAGLVALRVQIILKKRVRLNAYDAQFRTAVNRVLALGEQHQVQGVVERTEPLRLQVERALSRVEADLASAPVAAMPAVASNEVPVVAATDTPAVDAAATKAAGDAEGIVFSLSKTGDAVRLLDFLKAKRPGSKDVVARNREIATVAYLMGWWDVAHAAITSILLCFKNDLEAITRSAQIAFLQGNMDEAKAMYERVLQIAKAKNDAIDEAAALVNLGVLHQLIDELNEAEMRIMQALALYRRLQREDGQADCYGNLAFISQKRGNMEDAEDMFRRAMAINERLDREEGLAICCGCLGLLVYQKDEGDMDEAEELLRKALSLSDRLGRLAGVATAYGNLGLVKAKRKDLKNAREFLMKALALYQKINKPKMVVKVQGMLTALSEAQRTQSLRA